jgi:hypothetical protein
VIRDAAQKANLRLQQEAPGQVAEDFPSWCESFARQVRDEQGWAEV